jgi:hypothetical protein
LDVKNMLFGATVLTLVVGVCGNAGAQPSSVEVKIPFAFLVHRQLLPAGEYVVEQTSTDILLIHGEHGTRGAAYVLARPDSDLREMGSRPQLTFTKDENAWRLASVEEPGTGENMVIDGVRISN